MTAATSNARAHTVIFDLDDTLIDWWNSLHTSISAVADQRSVDALFNYCQTSLWEVAPDGDHIWHRNTWALHTHRRTIWPEALHWMDDADLQALMRAFERELWVGFFPDTIETLETLGQSHRLAVLTNNHTLESESKRLGLPTWFDVAVAAIPPHQPKPHPSAFSLVLHALGETDAARCVYVGDSIKSDVMGARGAGLIPVWLNSHGDLWVDRPSDVHEISCLAELPALLQSV